MKKFARIMAVALVAVLALAVLAACGPAADPDKALAALKKNGYTSVKTTGAVSLGVTEALLGAERGDLEAIVSGSKTDDNDKLQTITIYYFKDAAAANKCWEKAQSESNKDKDKDKESDWVCQKSGKIIYYGTKQAVKDAR